MKERTEGVSIAYKLALLAGLPVAGALVLAWIVISDAREQVRSAAALGSVEDLAKLAGRISGTVHALQLERAGLAWHVGSPADDATKARFSETDRAFARLNTFLEQRDVSRLPARLARDLSDARKRLSELGEQRKTAQRGDADLVKLVSYYHHANSHLISAIAALMQLSDHGELLRTLSTLVSVLQIKESASQEHAVLVNVFEQQEFAPGAYKELVTLVTEYQSNERVLHATADDRARADYEKALAGDFASKTAKMREVALTTMDDDFGVDTAEWFKLQSDKIESLRGLENKLNADVKTIASARLAATERTLTTGTSLSVGVLLSSILLAWLIGRGVSRSVTSLTTAAGTVRRDKDYGARAKKVSNDELGMLTDAFNEMLAGIQARDGELEHHRENLEKLVDERTSELTARNEAMRVVLDNVEQGLATVRLDGSLAPETSKAFEHWFGAPTQGIQLPAHLEQFSPKVAAMTEVAWDCVAEDLLPWDLCLEQMPADLSVEGREYRLAYRGIVHDDKLEGALLVISDITEERARERREAVQQEMLGVFAALNEDRVGFIEFLDEARRLVQSTRKRQSTSMAELMRTVHTVKGNCNIFGVVSVGQAAHALESFIVDNERVPEDEAFDELYGAWDLFESRVASLVTDSAGSLEISDADLQAVLDIIDGGAPQPAIRAKVAALRLEPVEKRLARIGDRARRLSKRLGKGDLEVIIEAGDERLSSDGWTKFFGTLVHAVRNSIDHGIERPDERKAAGKPNRPALTLRFHSDAKHYVMELQDDGRGIDWDKLASKAKAKGLPAKTEQDRMEALFADGISSSDQVTDQSGRGVGMSALREAVRTLGGEVTVQSATGTGTTLRFTVPIAQPDAARHVA